MKKQALLLCLTLIMAFSALPAFADDDVVDFTKLSCTDINDTESQSDRLLAILWIDGYISAETGSAEASDAWYIALYEHIEKYCATNTQASLFEAVQQMDNTIEIDGPSTLDTPCSNVINVAENEDAFGGMLMWVDGYVSFKSNSGVLDETWFENTAEHLVNYCLQNSDASLGDAIEGLTK